MSKEYDKISRPFGGHLERDQDNLTPDIGEGSFGVAGNGGLGKNQNNEGDIPLNTSEKIGDLWIDNFIKSYNWKPKKQGFYLDGLTGYAEFSNVFVSGDITAYTGYIGGESGWVISEGYIKDVSGATGLSSVVTVGNDIRFWAGDVNPASAPFRVYENGDVFANSMTLSGYIVVGGGEADVASTLTQLSDLDSNLGSITAGTVTGALIRTSSSGSRVQLNNSTNTMQIYDNSSVKRAESFQDGIQFYRSTGTLSGSISDNSVQGAFIIEGIGRNVGMITNSNQVEFGTPTVGLQLNETTNSIRANGTVEPWTNLSDNLGSNSVQWSRIYGDRIYAGSSIILNGVLINNWTDVYSGANTSLSNLGTTSINSTLTPAGSTQSLGTISLPWNRLYVADINLTGNITFSSGEYINSNSGSNDIRYYAGDNHEFYRGTTIKAIIDANIWTAGTLSTGGAKPFVIKHPDKSGRLLRYTAQESPEVLLRHRGKAVTDADGKCIITPPDHFTLVTDASGDVTINLTVIGNYRVWSFEEPTTSKVIVASDSPGVSFHYEVIAVRDGFIDSKVEIDKADPSISENDLKLISNIDQLDEKTRVSTEENNNS